MSHVVKSGEHLTSKLRNIIVQTRPHTMRQRDTASQIATSYTSMLEMRLCSHVQLDLLPYLAAELGFQLGPLHAELSLGHDLKQPGP